MTDFDKISLSNFSLGKIIVLDDIESRSRVTISKDLEIIGENEASIKLVNQYITNKANLKITNITFKDSNSANIIYSSDSTKRFIGWFTDYNETTGEVSGTQYNAGDRFTPTQGMEFYAKWERKYTVTFNSNYVNGPSQTTVIVDYNTPFNSLIFPNLTREDGYIMKGATPEQTISAIKSIKILPCKMPLVSPHLIERTI